MKKSATTRLWRFENSSEEAINADFANKEIEQSLSEVWLFICKSLQIAGFPYDDAQDITQDFFCHLALEGWDLEKRDLKLPDNIDDLAIEEFFQRHGFRLKSHGSVAVYPQDVRFAGIESFLPHEEFFKLDLSFFAQLLDHCVASLQPGSKINQQVPKFSTAQVLFPQNKLKRAARGSEKLSGSARIALYRIRKALPKVIQRQLQGLHIPQSDLTGLLDRFSDAIRNKELYHHNN